MRTIIPYLNLMFGTISWGIQVFVLVPWHTRISKQIKQLDDKIIR
jgi:hypothetical protein